MITRITKEEAGKRIGARLKPRNDEFGVKGVVLMIGGGRYYFKELDTTPQEMQLFINEWQDSKGKELPSFQFPIEEAR